MTARKKRITMLVTVSAPQWLTAAQARREVRALINAQCFYGHRRPDGDHGEINEYNFRAAKIAAVGGKS